LRNDERTVRQFFFTFRLVRLIVSLLVRLALQSRDRLARILTSSGLECS
jgi:hypothetical protein